MSFDVETLKNQIPFYLTASPDKKLLLTEIKALSEGAEKGYYIPPAHDPFAKEMLQGDGLRGFQIYSFATGQLIQSRGIILSNSCDIDPDNDRNLPTRVTFAPMIKLSRLAQRFGTAGLEAERVQAKISAIKGQNVTSMFYLPSDGVLDDDYVALLDDLHSMPVDVLTPESAKVFTLSMAGFYMLAFKLSVHFCRLHENVDRSDRIAA